MPAGIAFTQWSKNVAATHYSNKREIRHGEPTYGPLPVPNFTFIGAENVGI